jgi:glycosyltransferase involved in cell wall biosynthesis
LRCSTPGYSDLANVGWQGRFIEDVAMLDRIRVALVAPPWFDVPPTGYGGIEQVVGDLAEALTRDGHEVTLVAAGRDGTPARLLRTYEEPPTERLGEALPEVIQAAAAARLLADLDVDIVHDHTLAGPLTAAGRRAPTVATMHGPVEGDLVEYYRQLGPDIPLVAISNAQRMIEPDLNWVATVHNGIAVDTFPFQPEKEGWLLFIGRFTPDKGPDLAIDAAKAAGRHLVLAGKVNEPDEQEYFDEVIRPRLGPDVTYVGEMDAKLKRELYAKASCLLFPIRWAEPFGIVMVEAMACGTPVVALRNGSVPEVIADGRSGIICENAEELPAGIEKALELRPADCRDHVARNFDLATMAHGYEQVYRRLIG